MSGDAPKKLAFFVEGQTEQILLKRLISEYANANDITFDVRAYSTDKLVDFRHVPAKGLQCKYFILLFNCESDGQVKSAILDRRESLQAAGYSLILGLRDLYPLTLSDLPQVQRNLVYGVPTSGVPILILLAVAEVEAWFLQNAPHYSIVDSSLDVSTFKAEFGFDPLLDSAETVEHPALLLHEIYSSVGKSFKKRLSQVNRTVNALDIDDLCLSTVSLLPHFHVVLNSLDNYFAFENPKNGSE